MAPGRTEPSGDAPSLAISVAFSPRAGEVDEVALRLPLDATLADAVDASGLAQRHPQVDLASLATGIWGAPAPLAQRLRDRDRVELYRPLSVDPMEARRRRAASSTTTGRQGRHLRRPAASVAGVDESS